MNIYVMFSQIHEAFAGDERCLLSRTRVCQGYSGPVPRALLPTTPVALHEECKDKIRPVQPARLEWGNDFSTVETVFDLISLHSDRPKWVAWSIHLFGVPDLVHSATNSWAPHSTTTYALCLI